MRRDQRRHPRRVQRSGQPPGPRLAGSRTGRAAELASKAARAEGASPPTTASGRRPAVVPVKRDRGMRPIALDLTVSPPHLHRWPPGHPRWASTPGGCTHGHPPAPLCSGRRLCGRPGNLLLVDNRWARQPCKMPTSRLPKPEGPGDGWRRGPGGRHSSAADPARRSGRRTPTGSRHPPAAGYRPPGRPPRCEAPRTW